MGTVAFVFAPLAPLVSLAAAIVFWISSWVYKYQLMFVFITRVETGGVCIKVCVRIIPLTAILPASLESGRQQVASIGGSDANADGSQ